MHMKKDLLGLREMSAEEIKYILQSADTMRYILRQPIKRAPHLLGKSIVEMIYEEDTSTRTRVSFSLAAKYMQGTITVVSCKTDGGERLIDTTHIIDEMSADTIILRHPMSGAVKFVAENCRACVINAGDGFHEQPTEGLTDLFTIREEKGHIEGLRVAVIGDVLHSRIVKSDIYGLVKLGAQVAVGGPAALLPRNLEALGVKSYPTISQALTGADVVIVARLKQESIDEGRIPSRAEYKRFFCMDEARMARAKPDAIVLHSGTTYSGVEVSAGLLQSGRSMVSRQIENGVAVKMAVLHQFSRKGTAYEIVD